MFQSEEILPFPVEAVVHIVVVDGCQYPGLLEALLIENKKFNFKLKQHNQR